MGQHGRRKKGSRDVKQSKMSIAISQRNPKPHNSLLDRCFVWQPGIHQIGCKKKPWHRVFHGNEKNGVYLVPSWFLFPIAKVHSEGFNCSTLSACLIQLLWQPIRNSEPSIGSNGGGSQKLSASSWLTQLQGSSQGEGSSIPKASKRSNTDGRLVWEGGNTKAIWGQHKTCVCYKY